MTTGPHEESPATQAPYARRMDRESSVSYMGCLFSVLAGSEETDGRFGLMEMVAPKGREPSRHLHHTDDEGFYVLEGELIFYVGEEIYEASPGTFVFLPQRHTPLLYLRDRRGAHALHHRAGRLGETLPGCSVQQASHGHDAGSACRSARPRRTGGYGRGPGQLRHRGSWPSRSAAARIEQCFYPNELPRTPLRRSSRQAS